MNIFFDLIVGAAAGIIAAYWTFSRMHRRTLEHGCDLGYRVAQEEFARAREVTRRTSLN